MRWDLFIGFSVGSRLCIVVNVISIVRCQKNMNVRINKVPLCRNEIASFLLILSFCIFSQSLSTVYSPERSLLPVVGIDSDSLRIKILAIFNRRRLFVLLCNPVASMTSLRKF